MKKLLFWILVAVLAAWIGAECAQAAPFLACDVPPAEDKIVKYTGKIDGVPFETQYQVTNDGSAAIIVDLAALDDGVHQVTEIRAVNERGQSSPVNFTVPKKPSSPSGIRFSP